METASKGQANLVEEILKKKRRGKPLVTAVELDPQGYTAFGRVARETPASLGLFANIKNFLNFFLDRPLRFSHLNPLTEVFFILNTLFNHHTTWYNNVDTKVHGKLMRIYYILSIRDHLQFSNSN